MKYNLSEAEYEIMQFIWKNGDDTSFSDIMGYTQKKGIFGKNRLYKLF